MPRLESGHLARCPLNNAVERHMCALLSVNAITPSIGVAKELREIPPAGVWLLSERHRPLTGHAPALEGVVQFLNKKKNKTASHTHTYYAKLLNSANTRKYSFNTFCKRFNGPFSDFFMSTNAIKDVFLNIKSINSQFKEILNWFFDIWEESINAKSHKNNISLIII